MSNTTLKSEKIIKTVRLLKVRIEERFPDSSLANVCGDLKEIAKDSDNQIIKISKTNIWYRLSVFIFVGFVLSYSAYWLSEFGINYKEFSVPEMLELLNTLMNIFVLVAGAIISLVSIENRIKRNRVIRAINVLRSLAHVIDSHQLTKDPCYMTKKFILTEHSPKRTMNSFELFRYLNYCTEMLSIISKIAFLYVQDYHDDRATKAVKDLEDLTNGLSRKIWQKIMHIDKEKGICAFGQS